MSDIAVLTEPSISEELIFDNTTVSKILGVQVSTLRKYCTLMQKHQYEFQKNSVGHRVFYKNDVEVLKEIIDLKNSSSLTLEQAVKSILKSDVEDAAIESGSNADYHKLLEEFATFRKEQMEFNKQLIEQLHQQEHYIKNSLEDRDNKLVYALKESMEARRQLAIATEEVVAVAVEARKKKNPWWKFWNLRWH